MSISADKMELIKQNATPTQWKYLELYLRGWSLTSIAKRYGVSVKTVSVSIKRAKKRLKKRLKWVISG